MSNGRNDKIRPMGFYAAALKHTSDLSTEAASNFTRLVKDVATQYHYNDSAALNNLRSRLNVAARRKATRAWAVEVLALLAHKKSERLRGATA